MVATTVLILAGGAYLYAKAQPSTYKASGRVFLNAGALAGESSQDMARLISTQADLASSTPVLIRMSNRLGIPTEEVEQRLTVTPAPQGNYFRVEGTGETPAAAVKLVTSAEKAYQEVVSAQQQKSRQGALEDLVEARTSLAQEYDRARAQLAQAPKDPQLRAQAEILGQQLRTLRARQGDALISAQASPAVQLAEAPQLPTAPAAPKPLWIGVVGGLLGAIIGVAFVWWRSEQFAVTHQPAIAAEQLGLPLLGRVRPQRGRQAKRLGASGGDPDIAQLALAIELAGRRQLGHNLGVLGLVYSDLAGSIATVTLGLASALGSAGRQVLVADGIQDQPLIATLTAQGLLPPNLENLPALRPLTIGTEPDFLVLSLGLDGRPGQAATAQSALVDARRAGNLVVLLASAPNTPQAALLVTGCDALVLIARSRTRLAALMNTKARLDDLDRPILGLVFDKTIRSGPLAKRHRRRQAESRARSARRIPAWTEETSLGELPRRPGAAPDRGSNGGRSRTNAPDLADSPVEQDPGLAGITPRGWREYIEPRFDYGIAVPPEWKPVEGRAEVLAFYDPRTDALVSVERAEKPEALPEHPLAGYDEDQYRDYRRIKLESTRFKGVPALDWEFVHSVDRTRLHTSDLRLFIGDDVVYRMSFQSPDEVWSKLQSTLERIRGSLIIGIRNSA